ncbi:MAG: hypothetical protein JKP97_02525 [Rhodobacteraceae bacterium]|nr:hypothetical protein [Paracoccaceae bacterium]
MGHDNGAEIAVDRALSALRDAPPPLPPGLHAAVLRDADAVQAGFARPGRVAAPAPFWPTLWAALGGGLGGTALAGAAVAGIVIGLAGTGPIATLVGSATAVETGDLFGGYAVILEEG